MDFFALLAQGADTLFTFTNLLLLSVGVCLGIFAGSLPGLSSSNTCAIMLPLTLGMSMEGALIFMVGIYCGAQYGGAIPAILLRTPGTTGAGATTIEGYPMSLQGKADVALGVSLLSSSLAGIIASVVCLAIIKSAANIALSFGPAEVFLLALTGILLIASLLGDSVRKGLLSGFIGLLLSTMSADPLLGKPRLNFGFLELYDEFPMIPALVGLFAIPALIDLVGKKRIAEGDIQKIGTIAQTLKGFKETIARPFNLIRSTFIGLLVGILPGAGIETASFLAYGQAKIWSKDKKTFGKGNIDGLIAAESSNNAVTAGALVPTFLLGIPGSATMAVMLASLTLHGVTPGPQVLQRFPSTVYALLLATLVASIIFIIFGFYYNRMVSQVTRMNLAYLLPATFVICVIGAYAVRYFTFDVYLLIIFGVLGVIMHRQKYPYLPLILGLVMGPIAEDNYSRAIALSNGSFKIFFASDVAKIMWAVILVVLIVPRVSGLLRKIRAKSQSRS